MYFLDSFFNSFYQSSLDYNLFFKGALGSDVLQRKYIFNRLVKCHYGRFLVFLVKIELLTGKNIFKIFKVIDLQRAEGYISNENIFGLPQEILFKIVKMAGMGSSEDKSRYIRLACKPFHHAYCRFTSCGYNLKIMM